MTLSEQIGIAVADLRKKRGYTIRQFAEICGVPFQNVTKIEHGKYNPSLPCIERIMDALDAEIIIRERGQGKQQ